MNKTLVNPADEALNYGELFHTDLDVKIIKKDGFERYLSLLYEGVHTPHSFYK